MSLSKQDLKDIRGVVLDALDKVVTPRLERIEAQLDEHTAILTEHTAMLAEHGHRLMRIEARGLIASDNRVQALMHDVRELYGMVGQQANGARDKGFTKLPPEQKVRQLHAELLRLAQQMHVEL